ncbi:DICT sensory domain-containing protein [Actinoplanes sp. NPDC023801]|uniref:DICT sensory domain-containing protein n=1 Tax=Actinoplanes sp. NPDC023801 TaxID=3154595 RepID=UPI0033E7073F
MPNRRATRLVTKKTLVGVSHALEHAALAVAEDGPMLVIALFQRLPYFERERRVYERIAGSADVTVVGLTAEAPPDPPAGSHVVLLDGGEALAREWTLVVLTPRFGAVLVAHDREQVTAEADTLEAGRLFDGWWSLRRDDALHEALRLRDALADRLPPAAHEAFAGVVARVRDLPSAAGESRADAVVGLLVEQAERAGSRLAAVRRQVAAAQQQAMTADDEVRRWSGASGVTASGTLPLALLAVRVPPAHRLPEQTGRRTGALRNEGLIEVLTTVLRDTDRLSRLGEDDFLLMLPALAADDAVKIAHRLHADLAAASVHNPFLSSAAHVVVMVTRRRPFPTQRLQDALEWAQRENVPVATLGDD